MKSYQAVYEDYVRYHNSICTSPTDPPPLTFERWMTADSAYENRLKKRNQEETND